jgi:hypothetical protein
LPGVKLTKRVIEVSRDNQTYQVRKRRPTDVEISDCYFYDAGDWRYAKTLGVTNTFSAEYGMSMGSQMTIVSKTGTNQFHGSAFEYIRNAALDARNFFARPEDAAPRYQRNQFGFSLFKEVLAESDGGNVFISPLSVSMALGMTYNALRAPPRMP